MGELGRMNPERSNLTPLRWPEPADASPSQDWLWESARCATDHGGRRFLEALRAMLARVHPAQVDPTTTSAFGEPAALYAAIPHRDLGGLSLVVRFCDGRADMG